MIRDPKHPYQLVFHHGALFSGPLVKLGYFLLFGGLVLLGYGIYVLDWILCLSGILSAAGGFEFFRSIRGVIIDFEKGIVRSYLQVFGLRRGPSKELAIFDRVVLTRHKAGLFKEFVHYEISLQDVDERIALFLQEVADLREAEQLLHEISSTLNLPEKNLFRERAAAGRRRRASIDSRSVRRRGRRR